MIGSRGLRGLALLSALVLASCEQVSPLGRFGTGDVEAWSSDCATRILTEDPRDPHAPGPLYRPDGPAFSRAVLRYRCQPPGWAVYVDKGGRTIGLCVDEENQNPAYGEEGWPRVKVIPSEVRARRLISKHWGSAVADEMVAGECLPEGSVVDGMTRWRMSAFMNPDTPVMYSWRMCCWEVGRF